LNLHYYENQTVDNSADLDDQDIDNVVNTKPVLLESVEDVCRYY